MPAFQGRRTGIPVDARVEWRSERHHAETPIALMIDDDRHEVEVIERWVEGPADAGGPVVRCFVVRGANGRSYVVRLDSAGSVTVATVQ
jgi:hypothetical protein